jgi:hypothetical protein
MLLFLTLPKTYFNKFLRISNLHLFFCYLEWLLSYLDFCDFSLNKNGQTYLGPIPPPGGLNYLTYLSFPYHKLLRRHDTQHNGYYHDDTQHNITQNKLSITALSITLKCQNQQMLCWMTLHWYPIPHCSKAACLSAFITFILAWRMRACLEVYWHPTMVGSCLARKY